MSPPKNKEHVGRPGVALGSDAPRMWGLRQTGPSAAGRALRPARQSLAAAGCKCLATHGGILQHASHHPATCTIAVKAAWQEDPSLELPPAKNVARAPQRGRLPAAATREVNKAAWRPIQK